MLILSARGLRALGGLRFQPGRRPVGTTRPGTPGRREKAGGDADFRITPGARKPKGTKDQLISSSVRPFVSGIHFHTK